MKIVNNMGCLISLLSQASALNRSIFNCTG